MKNPLIFSSASGVSGFGEITGVNPEDISKNGINGMSIACDAFLRSGSFVTEKIPFNIDAEI